MHTFGSIDNSMQILNYQKKCLHLDTTEKFYIHTEASPDNQFNDKLSFPIKPLILS